MADNDRQLEPSFGSEIPSGDERERSVCGHCGFIDYVNPKIVVGVVAHWQDEILLCKRSIEPRHGFWTLPAGFMEEKETTEAGAKREAYEEARANLEIIDLLALYNVSHVSQVHIFYRARLLSADVSPGPESLEVGFFAWENIPWDELSFTTVRWALEAYQKVRHETTFVPFRNPE